MITSLLFSLTPEEPVQLSTHLGAASHAILLKLIAEADPKLAEALHAPNEIRPFTCSTIWGAPTKRGRLRLEPDNPVYLRYTGLTEAVSDHLRRLASDPPEAIEVHDRRLSVVKATLDPSDDGWAGQATYKALADGYLLAERAPSHRSKLWFASPTAFRSGGKTLPVPLPELVYGSLLDVWNTFSPVSLSEEVRRFAVECMAISRYKLSTRVVPGKDGSLQIGFVGTCQYTALNRDRYWLSVIQLLTDYAFYAGVGYRTTAGLGQVRRA